MGHGGSLSDDGERIAAILEDGIIVATMRRTSRKSKKRAGKRAKPSGTKKRTPVETVPSPAAWTQQDTTADLLLQRGAVMRQRFIAATQPAQEVFAPAGPFGGTAPQATNATIALTIAKAEAHHAEILTRISAIEATIAKLREASTATRFNQPPPLTVQEAEQIHNIFIVIKEQPAVPTQAPATEVNEAPANLNSFVNHLNKYIDNDDFCTEFSKSAGAAAGKAVIAAMPIAAIVYLLIDQLTALSNLISDWLSTIATLLG
jgi:hypothetical protein